MLKNDLCSFKNPAKIFSIIFAFIIFSSVSYAAVSVETFTCNGQSGTVVAENSATFSCQASIKNEDTQNSASISSVLLLVNGNWAESTSYTGSGFSTSIGAGASTTATFSGIRAVAPGPTNKFQSIQIDSGSDTFVTNTNVNIIAIKSISVTASASGASQGTEFDVEASVIAGGDLASATMTWSSSGGCTLSSGHTASKSAGSLSHNTEATRSWRVVQGSADCTNTITASGTSSSVTTTKSGSIIVSFTGGGSSPPGSSTSSTGGGGGGGGGAAAKVSETKTIKEIIPGFASTAEFVKTAVSSISIDVLSAARNVVITIEEVASPNVPALQDVYKYIDISVVNLSDSNIRSAGIVFYIDKAWLADKEKGSVRLNRYAGSWQQLPTSMVEENATTAKYRATTTGFSVFAITAEPAVAHMPSCGNNLKEGLEECDRTDMAGQTCISRGFSAGVLSCSSTCRFDTTGCMQHVPSQQQPSLAIPPEAASNILYVIVALIIVAALGYWHYHHSPHKNKRVYRHARKG